MHTQSLRGCHSTSLFPSPQVSLSDAPFLGAQGGDQSPFLPVGVCPDWGLALWPYLTLWPFLVSPVGVWPSGVRMLVQKRIWNEEVVRLLIQLGDPLL